MVLLVPEVDEIMITADLGRRDAHLFRCWFDDLPPSKRGDWTDRLKEWQAANQPIQTSLGMAYVGPYLGRVPSEKSEATTS